MSGPIWAGSPAGEAVDVDPQAVGTLEGTANGIPLASGDGIFLGQTLVTGAAGQVQIVFSDDTHLVIGPDATLVISEYLMRNDGTASKFVIDALSGTFRFLTGNSPKNAYRIDTPTGTLGVRGTAFDLTVDPLTKESDVLLYHGGVNLCGDGGCKLLTEACGVGQIPQHKPSRIIGHADNKRKPLLAKFPFLASQIHLKSGFQVQGTKPCQKTQAAVLTNVALTSNGGPPASSSSEEPPASSSSAEPPPSSSSSAEPPPSSSSEEPDDEDEPHGHGHHYGWFKDGPGRGHKEH